jgi:hypothetical protein
MPAPASQPAANDHGGGAALPPPPSPPPAHAAGVSTLLAPLLRQSLNGFAVVDAAGHYAWVSDSMCLLLGVAKETLLGCVPRAQRLGPWARFCALAQCATHGAVARIARRHSGDAAARARVRRRFAVLDAAAVVHARAQTQRRRAAADLVFADDRAPLAALLAEARRAFASAPAPAPAPADAFVRVRHTARDGAFAPVEVKACADDAFVYCVLLDARMPARLEGLLPDFLLSTSARGGATQAARSGPKPWPSVAPLLTC